MTSKTTTTKRLLSLVLCLCMILSMMPGLGTTASAVSGRTFGFKASDITEASGVSYTGNVYVYCTDGSYIGTVPVGFAGYTVFSAPESFQNGQSYDFYMDFVDSEGNVFKSETKTLECSAKSQRNCAFKMEDGTWFYALACEQTDAGGGVSFTGSTEKIVDDESYKVAAAGTEITATAVSVDGYTAVLSTDDVTATTNSNGSLSFYMPTKAVTVTATYTPIETQPDYTLILKDGVAYKNTAATGNEVELDGLSYADGIWTMNNFSFNTTAEIAVKAEGDTTINLAGANAITAGAASSYGASSKGIQTDNALTITSSATPGGSLTVTGGTPYGNYSYGIFAGSLTVSGSAQVISTTCAVAGSSSSYGVRSESAITVSDTAILTGTGIDCSGSYGIDTVSLTVSDSAQVSGNATSSIYKAKAILIGGDASALSVSGSAKVTGSATATDSGTAYAVFVSTNSGTLDVTAKDDSEATVYFNGQAFYKEDTYTTSAPTVVLTAPTRVAQIGTTKYKTLADAIAAVQDNETIELLVADLGAAFPAYSGTKSFTIQGLEGGTSIAGANKVIESTDGSITFKNINWTDSFYGNKIKDATFEDCNFTGEYGIYTCTGVEGGTWTLTNCNFNQSESEYFYAFQLSYPKETEVATVIATGCTFRGAVTFATPATVTYTNCTFLTHSNSKGYYVNVRANTVFTNCQFAEEFATNHKVQLRANGPVIELNGCTVTGGGALADLIFLDTYTEAVVAIDGTKDNDGKYTAGTFVTDDAANIPVATGYEATAVSGQTTIWTVAEAAPKVARIGDVEYTSLDAALVAAQAMQGDVTITLLDSFSEVLVNHETDGKDGYIFANNLTITADKAVTVDLTGTNYKAALVAAPTGAITIGENVTLKNAGSLGNYHYHEQHSDAFAAGGVVTVAGVISPFAVHLDGVILNVTATGKIEHAAEGDALLKAEGSTVYNITGNLEEVPETTTDYQVVHDCITVGDDYAGSLDLNLTKTAVDLCQISRTNAEQIDFDLNASYLYTRDPFTLDALTMSGNSIYKADAVTLGTSAAISVGSKIVSAAFTNNGTITIDTTGATEEEYLVIDYTGSEAKDLAAYGTVEVGDGYEAYVKDNDLYVKKAAAVAKIGDTKYETLAAAVAAVQDNETITLLTNVENAAGMTIATGKTFTIDFGGHTYTLNKPGAGSTSTQTQGFQILAGQTVTFKNGTINVAEDNLDLATVGKNIKRIIQNYANLTLEDMTLDGTNLYVNDSNTHRAVIETACGTVALTGSTTVTGKVEGEVLALNVDTWKIAAYAAGTQVTINTTGTIDGIYCYTEETAANYTKSSLTLTAGKINSLTVDNSGEYVVTKADAVTVEAPAGYKWVNGTLTACTYVAQIGDTKYETLAAAVAAVKDNDTITLLADITLTARIDAAVNAAYTIDLDGHQIGSTATCGNGSVFNIKAGTVTIKNGKLVGIEGPTGLAAPYTNECDVITVRSGATANLEDLNVSINCDTGCCAYAFVGGTINVKSGTYENTTTTADVNGKLTGMLLNQEDVADQLIVVTGGTFKGANPALGDNSGKMTSFLAEGYYSYATADGWVVNNNAPVAQIGTTKYETLAAAVAAVKDNDTITLLADCKLTQGIDVDKKVTLDLAGHEITAAADWTKNSTAGTNGQCDYLLAVMYGGNLTIDGYGTIDATTNSALYAAVKTTIYGETDSSKPAILTVNSGTIKGYYYGITGNGTRPNTQITINGGTIKGTAENDSVGIFHPQNGTLIIHNGFITGAMGVYVKAGKVTVDGGTIKGTGDEAAYQYSKSGFNSTGDAFVVDNCGYPGSEPVITITLGTFKSTKADAVASYGYDTYPQLTGFIYGGTFSSDPGDLVATEHYTINNFDGTWTVKASNKVARIEGKTFTSLSDAFTAAVEDGDTTVQIMNNIDSHGDAIDLKNDGNTYVDVTLDLNGKTIGGCIQVEGKVQLTVIDTAGGGTIKGESSALSVYKDTSLPGSSSAEVKLVVESGTLESTEGYAIYAIGGSADSVTIRGGTLIGPEETDCGAILSPDKTTITGGIFQGEVCLGDKDDNTNDGAITGGIFTVDPTYYVSDQSATNYVAEGYTATQTDGWYVVSKEVIPTYSILISASGGGTVTAWGTDWSILTTDLANETQFRLSIEPDTGYKLKELSINGDEVGTDVVGQTNGWSFSNEAYWSSETSLFTINNANVNVIAVFELEEETEYTVTCETSDASNGTVITYDPLYGNAATSKTAFKQGDLVAIKATPASGYNLADLTVTANGEKVDMVDSISFYMPGEPVTVTATFKADVIYHPAIPATCTTAGRAEYWECDGKYYKDAACTETVANLGQLMTEIDDHKESLSSWTWVNTSGSWKAYYAACCSKCGMHITTKGEATVSSTTKNGQTTYIASVTLNDVTYTTTKTVDTTYTVTYDGTDYALAYGKICSLTAAKAVDWYADGTLVKTNSKSYSFVVASNVKVTTATATATKPVVSLTATDRAKVGTAGKTKITYTVQWSVPTDYTFVSAGILRAYNVGENPALSALTTNNRTSLTTANGTYTYNVNMSAATSKKSITAIAYLTYQDASGNTVTIYSDQNYQDGYTG